MRNGSLRSAVGRETWGRGQASLGRERLSRDLNGRWGSGEVIQAEGAADALESGMGLGRFREEQECEGGWGQDEVRGQGSKASGRTGGRWGGG